MGREVPFKANKVCDECGKSGAFDFMGDYICSACLDGEEERERARARRCDCGAMAVWDYAPADADRVFCEDCVPRGCSCHTMSGEDHPVDEKGRELPCVEYWFCENGVPPVPQVE